MATLICTSKSLTGQKGTSWGLQRLKHFSWLPQDSTFLTSTPSIEKYVNDYLGSRFKFISPYLDLYNENRSTAKNYGELWDKIDPKPLQDYSSIVVIGMVYDYPTLYRRANLEKLKGFPGSYTGVKYKTLGAFIPNLMGVAKASQEYHIPVHVIADDPDEFTYDLWDEQYRPWKYTIYHGYDTPYGHHRLDSFQYFFKYRFNKRKLLFIDKEYDFVVGCSLWKSYNREDGYEFLMDTASKFLKKGGKVKIFMDSNIPGIEPDYKITFPRIPHDEYLTYLAASKFTMMLPSCNPVLFSPYRYVEDLAMGCLPLISPHTKYEDFQKSFGYDGLGKFQDDPDPDMLLELDSLQEVFAEPRKFPTLE